MHLNKMYSIKSRCQQNNIKLNDGFLVFTLPTNHIVINLSNTTQTTLCQSYLRHAVSVITFHKPLSVGVCLVYSHHVGGGFYAPLTCTQP